MSIRSWWQKDRGIRGWWRRKVQPKVQAARADRQVEIRVWEDAYMRTPLTVEVGGLCPEMILRVTDACIWWTRHAGEVILTPVIGHDFPDIVVHEETPETPGASGETHLVPSSGLLRHAVVFISPDLEDAYMRTIRHELGHALGFMHIGDKDGIMHKTGKGMKVFPQEKRAMGWIK